ncbi:MAG: hypothetical protein HQK82_07585, partial [Desulfovibrionaceae bacterium]|nr:hypothetical protein [Desulfovibrionaceae bacterium]
MRTIFLACVACLTILHSPAAAGSGDARPDADAARDVVAFGNRQGAV